MPTPHAAEVLSVHLRVPSPAPGGCVALAQGPTECTGILAMPDSVTAKRQRNTLLLLLLCVCACVLLHLCVCMCMCVYVCVWVDGCVCVHARTCMNVCMHAVCVVCVYVLLRKATPFPNIQTTCIFHLNTSIPIHVIERNECTHHQLHCLVISTYPHCQSLTSRDWFLLCTISSWVCNEPHLCWSETRPPSFSASSESLAAMTFSFTRITSSFSAITIFVLSF